MSDNASTYPATIDPQPVTLEDDVDFVPADALTLAANQLAAIQGEVGNGPVDFTGLGALDYGTVADFLRARCRIEVGEKTLSATVGTYRVAFTSGRFTAPPFVMIQLVQATNPGQYDHFNAKRVTKDGFTVGSGHPNRSGAAGNVVWWCAIQPIFGVEESTVQTDD